MSPEQCRGAGTGLLDARSDIYSLGCVFYEMATGRRPFMYDNIGELIAAQPPRNADARPLAGVIDPAQARRAPFRHAGERPQGAPAVDAGDPLRARSDPAAQALEAAGTDAVDSAGRAQPR
jgi:serine/threonine protein kinase